MRVLCVVVLSSTLTHSLRKAGVSRFGVVVVVVVIVAAAAAAVVVVVVICDESASSVALGEIQFKSTKLAP